MYHLGTTFEWKQGLDHKVIRVQKQPNAARSSAAPQCRKRLARSGVEAVWSGVEAVWSGVEAVWSGVVKE